MEASGDTDVQTVRYAWRREKILRQRGENLIERSKSLFPPEFPSG